MNKNLEKKIILIKIDNESRWMIKFRNWLLVKKKPILKSCILANFIYLFLHFFNQFSIKFLRKLKGTSNLSMQKIHEKSKISIKSRCSSGEIILKRNFSLFVNVKKSPLESFILNPLLYVKLYKYHGILFHYKHKVFK